MIPFSTSKPTLLALACGGFLLGQAVGAMAQETAAPAPTGSITIPDGNQPVPVADPSRPALGDAFGGSGSLINGEQGRLMVPGQDVLKSTATPIEENAPTPVTPGAPAVDPRPNMTGGKGISINGEEADSQRSSGTDSFDDRKARLSPDIGKNLGADPKYSRGVGEMTRGQQEALPTIDQLRDDKSGRAEFIWMDQAKFVKAPMEAPDRVKIRWKNRDYVIRLYFVASGDAGVADSRRTMQMAGRMMVKPEQAAEAFTKACEETRTWLEETPNLRVATRWEKVSPLKEDTDYYGFVYLGEESLGNRLVKTGWANSQGKKVTGPGEERPSEVLSVLQKLEQSARKERLGLWGWTGGPKGTKFVPER